MEAEFSYKVTGAEDKKLNVEVVSEAMRVSQVLRALFIGLLVIAVTYCFQMQGALLAMAFISILE